ncbi:MAG: glycoside hydrolase family 97 protein [Bacteroidales bacterium]|jgi:alpha-glucosidase|nr:glycoside hydrolase family 97 protein [Bacteroidales bacterium]
MKKTFVILLLAMFGITGVNASVTKILSPDGQLELQVIVEKGVSVRLFSEKAEVFSIEDIRLDTDKGIIPAENPRIRKIRKNSVNNIIKPVIKEKRAEIPEQYNETTIEFRDNSKLQFRLYNDGLAYRFILDLPGTIRINSDQADFVFDGNALITYQKDNNNPNSDYEKPYITTAINRMEANDMGNLPALVKNGAGKFVLFLEAGSKDYPVMWVKKTSGGLSSHYWGVPSGYNDKGNSYGRKRTTGNKDYIAETKASRNFPWKVFAFAEKETDLLTNQLVYLLGEECKIDDTSWIKPGWVTFDWWSRRGIYGVDFKAGVNTETAKYMVDFAHEFGIRYFLFDDGWTYKEDLTQAVPGLDIAEVVRYAGSKNVDVMLWVTYALFDDQMEKALEQFQKWGIKGIKIDFINRSDQEAVNFYWKAAEECARYKMAIDIHGAYRPDGLRRAYPNVLTREALIEFEYNGGRDWDNPDHHCTLPFIRNVAGPMDYIPGTMNNATKNDFRINGNKPMGQGTRAHAIAMAVIAESPIQMLSDAQPLYYNNRECTEFLLDIPVEWDEIAPLDAKIGDYVAIARRNGSVWYATAITDWDPRKINISLDFLEAGKEYTMEFIRDGINANATAVDYRKEIKRGVKKGDRIEIDMASGGGWIAKIEEK